MVTALEHDAPASWIDGLAARGRAVTVSPPGDPAYGYAHIATGTAGGMVSGAADPRAADGAAIGW